MDSLGKISGTEEVNLSLMKRIFQEVVNGMEAKEKELISKQESLAFSIQPTEKMYREVKMLLENGLEQMEIRKKELGLMLKDVVVRQQKMDEQERTILGLLEKIDVEGRQLQDTKQAFDEEIGATARRFEKWKKKARDLDEKEVKLEKLALEMDLKERVLGLKEKGLLAKVKELEAMEELWKLRNKHNESDPNMSPHQKYSRDLDLSNQSKYAGKRKKFRAREEESPSSFTNCKKGCTLEATSMGKEVIEPELVVMNECNEIGSAHSGHSKSVPLISSSDAYLAEDTLCSYAKRDIQVNNSHNYPVYYVGPGLNPVCHTNLFYDFEKR